MTWLFLFMTLLGIIIQKTKKGVLKTTLKLAAVSLFIYTGYLSVIWDRGWTHFEKGGGVFIYNPIDNAEMELALIQFKKFSDYSPLSTDSRNYSGRCLIYLGRYEEAIREFDKSLSIKNNFTANYRSAYAYKMLKDYKKMAESLNQASQQEENFNAVARFKREFADVKDHPLMNRFKEQL